MGAITAVAKPATAVPHLDPSRPGRRRRRANLLPYALITPTSVMICGVLAFPLGMLVWLSFQHVGLRELIAHQGVWVGLGNYRAILADQFFRQVVVRTLLFTLANVGLTIVLSTLIARLLLRVSQGVRMLLMVSLVFFCATPVIVAVDF